MDYVFRPRNADGYQLRAAEEKALQQIRRFASKSRALLFGLDALDYDLQS